MPQISQVLCCYKCEMFQVHQVKKSNKWQCRVCNEKQSLKKAFKIGPSRDCRSLVQKLNMKKSGFVDAENEDLEVCEKNNEWSEYETEAFNLQNYNERDNLSYSVVDGNETADSVLFEDTTISCCSASFPKLYEVDDIMDRNDILLENGKMCGASHCISNRFDEISPKAENTSQEKLAICEQTPPKKIAKCPSATQTNTFCPLPPPKKNKGFQFILKAASKLN